MTHKKFERNAQIIKILPIYSDSFGVVVASLTSLVGSPHFEGVDGGQFVQGLQRTDHTLEKERKCIRFDVPKTMEKKHWRTIKVLNLDRKKPIWE